jgi:hypothetical protein
MRERGGRRARRIRNDAHGLSRGRPSRVMGLALRIALGAVALLSVAQLGCGGDGLVGFDSDGGPGAPGGDDADLSPGVADGSQGLTDDGATPPGACDSASDRQGCPCAAGTPARACSTGPSPGTGLCTLGTQSCLGQSETGTTWGPCAGDAGACVLDAGPPPPGHYTSGCPPLSAGALHACAITPAGG